MRIKNFPFATSPSVFFFFFTTVVTTVLFCLPFISLQLHLIVRELTKVAMNTIYIGNLHQSVTPSLIQELFTQVAPVKSVHLPKDRVLQQHMGYGFVELNSAKDVDYCLKVLPGVKLFDQTMKLNKVNHEEHSLFVRNLDSLVDRSALQQVFAKFGELVDIKMGKGNATVIFRDSTSMQKALEVNGTMIMNCKVIVERKR